MSTPPQQGTITGTFADAAIADAAAEAARKAGFHVERQSGGVVAVTPDQRHFAADEIGAILQAYGAREYAPGNSSADQPEPASSEQRVRAEEGGTVELVEERLVPHTQSVQTGEVTIRREVITETRTIEVPVRREQLVIEHHPVNRTPVDSTEQMPADPLVQQLLERLRHMRSGETLRIPIIEEEVIVQKRPVVIEEITVGKRTVQDTQKVTDTVRREQARVEEHGDVHVHRQGT